MYKFVTQAQFKSPDHRILINLLSDYQRIEQYKFSYMKSELYY